MMNPGIKTVFSIFEDGKLGCKQLYAFRIQTVGFDVSNLGFESQLDRVK